MYKTIYHVDSDKFGSVSWHYDLDEANRSKKFLELNHSENTYSIFKDDSGQRVKILAD